MKNVSEIMFRWCLTYDAVYTSQPQMVTSLLREVINLKAVINELSVRTVVIFFSFSYELSVNFD